MHEVVRTCVCMYVCMYLNGCLLYLHRFPIFCLLSTNDIFTFVLLPHRQALPGFTDAWHWKPTLTLTLLRPTVLSLPCRLVFKAQPSPVNICVRNNMHHFLSLVSLTYFLLFTIDMGNIFRCLCHLASTFHQTVWFGQVLRGIYSTFCIDFGAILFS